MGRLLIYEWGAGASWGYKEADVGGKAWQLLRLKAEGLKVPSFFIIPWSSIRAALEPVIGQVEELARGAEQEGRHLDVSSLSSSIGRIWAAANWPTDWAMHLQEATAERFGADFEVAVRSSVTGEDGAQASFAGLHYSALGATANNLGAELKRCVASAWALRALAYRQELGLPLSGIQVSVVVQEMLDPVRSGVAFSMDVQGNLADVLIVAGYGQGLGLVDGAVPSDTYWVNRKDSEVRAQIANKDRAVRLSRGSLPALAAVQPEERLLNALSEEEAVHIAEQAWRAEQMLEKPADIEFAITADGCCWLLQARPVTTVPAGELAILDNTNIVESYPGLTLPLSFTFARWAYEEVFRGSAAAFGVRKRELEKLSPVLGQLIQHFHGRVYYRLEHWYQIMGQIYSSARALGAWEQAVGLRKPEREQARAKFQNHARAFLTACRLLLRLREGNRAFLAAFPAFYRRLEATSPDESGQGFDWPRFEAAVQALFRPWYQTLVNDVAAFQAVGRLQRALARWAPQAAPGVAIDLLSGGPPTGSEKALLGALSLKDAVLADPGLRQLFARPAKEVLQALSGGQSPDFYAQLQSHLENYGHRTLAELKLEALSFQQAPEQFIALLQRYMDWEETARTVRMRKEGRARQAMQTLKQALPAWHPAFWWVKVLAKLARYGVRNREEMRFCRAKAYGAVKLIFGRLGAVLAAKGVIAAPEDIFFLQLGEARACFLGGEGADLQHLVLGRKREFALWEKEQLPGRIIAPIEQLEKLRFQGQPPDVPADALSGTGVSGGRICAEAVVLHAPSADADVEGKILVTPMTDPGWVFLMSRAAGLASEQGSLLSHTAIIGRELGIPVIVGVKGATRHIRTGEYWVLDADGGYLRREGLKKEKE